MSDTPDIVAALVPITEMDDATLSGYRGSLARRLRMCPKGSARISVLQARIAAANAEEIARKKRQRGSSPLRSMAG